MAENDYSEVTSEVTRRSGRAERAHASSSTRSRGNDRRHERPRREPRNYRRTRVVSETVAAAVPEPTAALLFGAGLLVASHVNRRKQR